MDGTYKRLFEKYRDMYYRTHEELMKVSEERDMYKKAYRTRMDWWDTYPGKTMQQMVEYIQTSPERVRSFNTWQKSMKLA